MRAIDVHVHPMNQAYVDASAPFMPAAQRMFKGKFEARPDARSPRISAATTPWRSRSPGTPSMARPADVYDNAALAALRRDYPDVFLPGWAMVDPWRGRKGLEEIEHAIKTSACSG